jgi:hypothetical protein
MKMFLFKFDTNYEEAGIIVVANTLEKAIEIADKKGAWYTNNVEELTMTTGFTASVNFD